MSAFTVKDRTINQVVTWLHQQEPNGSYHRKFKEAFQLDLLDRADCDRLAQAMFELNCEAVSWRNDDYKAERLPAKFALQHEPATAVAAYKSLRCWRYQCAEGDFHETSLLFTIMGEILDCIAHEIVCSLPDYEKAIWD